MLSSATERQIASAALANRAVREARKASTVSDLSLVVARHQATNAALAQAAVTTMLAEQAIDAPPDAPLNILAFTTGTRMLTEMLSAADDIGFDRLVRALVQDAGRVAETVTIATRDRIGWGRQLNLPSCSRCVVLADRVYRYSDGFLRHPGDDCTTIAVREGDTQYVEDPVDLMKRGLVRGLSTADQEAIADGADFNKVVNVRRKQAGLTMAGRVLTRAGRPTPEGVLRIASDRAEGVELLKRYGYLL